MHGRYRVAIIVAVVLTAILFILPVYPSSSKNIAYSASGGQSDIQIMDVRAGAYVAVNIISNGAAGCQLAACQRADGDIVFSILSPGGSYLVRSENLSRTHSFSFIAWQPGHYRLNLTDPVPSGVFSAALNITVLQPVGWQYFPYGGAYVVKYPCVVQCVCVSGTCDNMDPLVPSR